MARILLVDGRSFTRDFFLGELASMGHEVAWVEDSKGLSALLEEQKSDLILLDPDLDGSKGWDLLEEIRRPGRPRIPTILFSNSRSLLLDPRAIVADGRVIKNAETQGLKAEISRVLGTVEVDITKGI